MSSVQLEASEPAAECRPISIWVHYGHAKMFGRIVRALGDGRIKIEAEAPMSVEAAIAFLTSLAERQKKEINDRIRRLCDEMTAMG